METTTKHYHFTFIRNEDDNEPIGTMYAKEKGNDVPPKFFCYCTEEIAQEIVEMYNAQGLKI